MIAASPSLSLSTLVNQYLFPYIQETITVDQKVTSHYSEPSSCPFGREHLPSIGRGHMRAERLRNLLQVAQLVGVCRLLWKLDRGGTLPLKTDFSVCITQVNGT